jgi:hypothetical protein
MIMARGALTVFQEFALTVGLEGHQLETDVLKIGIIDNVITPTAGDATPAWGATSGVDYDGNEVSTAGGYTANGETIANNTYTEAGGTGTLDGDNIALSQDGSGFTDAYWGIIYNDNHATKAAIAFVEFDGPVSEQAGPVAVNWNASGILTIAVT